MMASSWEAQAHSSHAVPTRPVRRHPASMRKGAKAVFSIFALCSMAFVSAAHASETKTYSYDALGRLVTTTTSGTVNNGATVTTGYDPADNRTSYVVTNSVSKVVVVPLNGFTVIPIPDN